MDNPEKGSSRWQDEHFVRILDISVSKEPQEINVPGQSLKNIFPAILPPEAVVLARRGWQNTSRRSFITVVSPMNEIRSLWWNTPKLIVTVVNANTSANAPSARIGSAPCSSRPMQRSGIQSPAAAVARRRRHASPANAPGLARRARATTSHVRGGARRGGAEGAGAADAWAIGPPNL